MNRLLLFVTLIASVLPVSARAIETQTSGKEYCYSAYHLQQQLQLTVKFGESIQRQLTKVDVDIHVREIPASIRNLSRINAQISVGKKKKIRSFIIFVSPNASKSNGIAVDMSQRYRHPFLVTVNGDTGELIDLSSTVKDQAILNEYMSFFDLFQYSERDGQYHYRNGNGRYKAKINITENKPTQLIRRNQGYLKTGNNSKHGLQVLESYLSIALAKPGTECFYQQGNGIENFKTTLSTKASVDGSAEISIESDVMRALDPAHFFYTLTDELATWPTHEVVKRMTKEEALSKLPFLMTTLSALTQDNAQFLQAMLADKEIWPYLADYILEKGISNDLSLQLFWALDRIDTSESVSALAKLATSPLLDREHFRAVMAIGSTSASLDRDGIELLQNHMGNFSNPEFVQPEKLTFVRMLGAMASRRNVTDPAQSGDMRSFLYSLVGEYEESVNAAVIDAIGNLKDSINSEGRDILLHGLSEGSDKIRLSAASAFIRVPYSSGYSDVFVTQLSNEPNLDIKNTLIEVLGKTDNTDLKVKQQLLSLINNSKFNNTSLSSLKKIDYTFKVDEIKLLESRLQRETDNDNQKLLASLILKHRRK